MGENWEWRGWLLVTGWVRGEGVAYLEVLSELFEVRHEVVLGELAANFAVAEELEVGVFRHFFEELLGHFSISLFFFLFFCFRLLFYRVQTLYLIL